MKVQLEKCNQCLFSENRIVSQKRAAKILQECAVNQTYFICHKATIAGKDVCCRGFYDSFRERSKHIQMAIWLKVLKFVTVTGKEKKSGNR